MKPRFAPVFAAALVTLAGCSKSTSEPAPAERSATPTTAASASAMAAASDAAAAHAGHATFGVTPGSSVGPGVGTGPADVAWDAPKEWVSAPNPSPMRKATYKIPKASGDAEDAELTVSSAGGGLAANIDRWAKQFGGAEPKKERRQVNGLDVTVVELKGTFSGGMGPMAAAGPKEKQMLLGAVVDGGETQHFFKMVGPEKTVSAARPDFDKLVGSLRAK